MAAEQAAIVFFGFDCWRVHLTVIVAAKSLEETSKSAPLKPARVRHPAVPVADLMSGGAYEKEPKTPPGVRSGGVGK